MITVCAAYLPFSILRHTYNNAYDHAPHSLHTDELGSNELLRYSSLPAQRGTGGLHSLPVLVDSCAFASIHRSLLERLIFGDRYRASRTTYPL